MTTGDRKGRDDMGTRAMHQADGLGAVPQFDERGAPLCALPSPLSLLPLHRLTSFDAHLAELSASVPTSVSSCLS